MRDEFLDIAVQEPTTLLGLELKPLTIGHCLLLDKFKCSPVEDVDGLITAVLICSRDHDQFQNFLDDRLLDWKMRLWHRRIGEIDLLTKLAER